jgi:hypothetical protein
LPASQYESFFINVSSFFNSSPNMPVLEAEPTIYVRDQSHSSYLSMNILFTLAAPAPAAVAVAAAPAAGALVLPPMPSPSVSHGTLQFSSPSLSFL